MSADTARVRGWSPIDAVRSRVTRWRDGRRGDEELPRPAAATWVAASPAQQTLSILLSTISTAIVILLANLLLLSPIQQATAQHALYDEFRLALAEGSVPVSPILADGSIVEPGSPIAMVSSSVVGLRDQIVVQGTAAAQTMQGIAHRRDTVMPCQPGSAVLMARAGSYGGLGSAWSRLQPGDYLTFTTGQGRCSYEVIGQRYAGDDAPPAPRSDEGTLVLTTAAGVPYMPTEVLRIDAVLRTEVFESAPAALPSAMLPGTERAMAVDDSPAVLFGLVLLLELLIAASAALTWMWRRWGRWQTWIVGLPVLAALAVVTANSLNQWLLPNLL